MGVCIPISMKSHLRKKTPKLQIFKAILIRSLKLIGIGLMLASRRGPVDIQTFRLPGVLQRFGVCYFFSATMLLLTVPEGFANNELPVKSFKDIGYGGLSSSLVSNTIAGKQIRKMDPRLTIHLERDDFSFAISWGLYLANIPTKCSRMSDVSL